MTLLDFYRQYETRYVVSETEPNGTDKELGHCYITGIYNTLFDKLLAEWPTLRILEIGVYGGHSLRLWQDYLVHRGAVGRVIGIDKDPKEEAGRQPVGTEIFVRDAYVPGNLTGLGTFHLVIEDGDHAASHQGYVILQAKELLCPGGVMVIEDIVSEYVLIELTRAARAELGPEFAVQPVDLTGIALGPDSRALVIRRTA